MPRKKVLPDDLIQYPLRDTPEIIETMRKQAHLHGRSLAAELRLAARLWLRECLLAQLADPVGREEARREGHDVDAEEKLLKAELREFKAQAFAVPEGPRLREVVANGRMH